MDRGWWGSRIQNLISHSHVGLPSWEDHIHLKSHARAIWWPHYAFYGKENSQCWSRQGGRAGEGALFIQYLFGPECNNSLSRMVVVCFVLFFCFVLWVCCWVFFGLSLFPSLKHLKGHSRKCQDFVFLPVLYEVTLQPLPGCQGTEPCYLNHDTYFIFYSSDFSIFHIGPWSRTLSAPW